MQPPDSSSAGPKRILVVDDEPTILEVIERLLETEGLVIVTARDGAEGLRRFREEKCDLVIVDRAMPGLSGEVMARVIKDQSPETPLILITGLLSGLIDATPFDGFVAKPFTRTQLRTAVAELLPDWREALAV